jgi:diguanylate cyclase (GGDEF)-like protein
MGFRISGRQDSLLVAGFAIALLVVFQRSLQYVFQVAREIERTYGVALTPALLILTVMFVFHMNANRREMRGEASAAGREAALAWARTRELEQLMAFGQALSRTLTPDALNEAIWRYLPMFAPEADLWMLVRTGDEWERVTDRSNARWPAGTIEAVADAIVRMPPQQFERPDGLEHGGFLCYVLGGDQAGVIGVAPATIAPDVRRTIGAAAALLGIALRNVQLFAEVRDHGLTDDLTGCFNRAHGRETLDNELARAQRSQAPLSLIMFDIDQFKRINDEHGHRCGDDVLAAVGQRLRQVLRRSDVRCRLGGDEFLIVLPETPAAGALRVAEWVRGEIQQIAIAGRGGAINPSISVGVATADAGEQADELLERADRALYAAKAAGRNCARSAARPVQLYEVLAADAG